MGNLFVLSVTTMHFKSLSSLHLFCSGALYESSLFECFGGRGDQSGAGFTLFTWKWRQSSREYSHFETLWCSHLCNVLSFSPFNAILRKHWNGWCFRSQFSPLTIIWKIITTQVKKPLSHHLPYLVPLFSPFKCFLRVFRLLIHVFLTGSDRWTREEKRYFNKGISAYRKDFFLVQTLVGGI